MTQRRVFALRVWQTPKGQSRAFHLRAAVHLEGLQLLVCHTKLLCSWCARGRPPMTAPQLALRITLAALCAPGGCPARGAARQHARIAARHTYRGAAARFAQLPVPCVAGERPAPGRAPHVQSSLQLIAVHRLAKRRSCVSHVFALQSGLFGSHCLHLCRGPVVWPGLPAKVPLCYLGSVCACCVWFCLCPSPGLAEADCSAAALSGSAGAAVCADAGRWGACHLRRAG